MDSIDWNKLVGKRCIVETKRWETQGEFVVIEVSPSGKYVKLRNKDGATWFNKWKIELLEALEATPG